MTSLSLSSDRSPAILSVHQLLHELDALEIEELRSRLHPTIKRHADRPGSSEDLGIREGRFVQEVIRGHPSVSLHYAKLLAVKVAGPVEPGSIVEPRNLDDERFALPPADRLPHPGFDGRRTGVFQVYVANRTGVLVRNENPVLALKNLKRIRHVRSAGNAGEITVDLR